MDFIYRYGFKKSSLSSGQIQPKSFPNYTGILCSQKVMGRVGVGKRKKKTVCLEPVTSL